MVALGTFLVPLELPRLHTMLVSIAWARTQLEVLPSKYKPWQYQAIFLWFNQNIKKSSGFKIIQT